MQQIGTLIQVPAAWMLGAVTMLAFGLLARVAAAVAWVGFIFVQVFEVLGPVAGVDFGVVEVVIPYWHRPDVTRPFVRPRPRDVHDDGAGAQRGHSRASADSAAMSTATGIDSSAVDGPDEAHRATGSASGRHRRLLRLGVMVIVAGVLAGTAVLVLPDVFGLDWFTPFAQLVSLRPYLVVGIAPVVLLLAGFAVWSRRRGRDRGHGRVLWVAVIGLAAVVVTGAVMVLPRTLAAPATAPATAGSRTFTVVAFNTLDGGADIAAVAALIRTERPDFVSLVEAGWSYRSRLAPLIEPLGYRLHTSIGEVDGDVGGVTVAVIDQLGDVDAGAHLATPFPSVEVSGGDLGSLRFVAFHSLAPRRGDVPRWYSDVAGVARWCGGHRPAIIAGDFNATFDHSVFRTSSIGCSDAAAERGQGLVPTWPTWLPDWMGPQIDHILATNPIATESFAVREIPGSDHRAVIARLRVPG